MRLESIVYISRCYNNAQGPFLLHAAAAKPATATATAAAEASTAATASAAVEALAALTALTSRAAVAAASAEEVEPVADVHHGVAGDAVHLAVGPSVGRDGAAEVRLLIEDVIPLQHDSQLLAAQESVGELGVPDELVGVERLVAVAAL